MTTPQNQRIPTSPMVDQTQRPTRAWQLFFLNLLNFSGVSTATAGSATLPAAPAGFIEITVNGESKKVPYYNP
tara:strand:- start:9651 stop:9869 length:219 start_codon:yes stop_codon:yes gene_type:complete